MGIDYGERRLGVAISDEGGKIAFPKLTVEGDEEAFLAAVSDIARQYDVELVVLGLPLTLSCEESEISRRARRFARRVEKLLGVRVVLWDERLTSVEAERVLREAGAKPSRNKAAVDRVAAAIILQSYIDAKRNEG